MMGKRVVHDFQFPCTIVTVDEKCKQLWSMEWKLEDFEDAIKMILTGTQKSDLDQLVKNFIQSMSKLQITETLCFVSN